MLQPGEEFPPEASATVASSIAAQTSGSRGTSDLADLAPATIAGIVLGVLGMCCVIIVIGFALYLRRTRQKRGKLAGVPMPSPVCQTPTTARIMVPEHNQGHAPCQTPDQPVSQTQSQTPCMSPCSPGSPYGFIQPPGSPQYQDPVEIHSNSRYELPGPDFEDPRVPR